MPNLFGDMDLNRGNGVASGQGGQVHWIVSRMKRKAVRGFLITLRRPLKRQRGYWVGASAGCQCCKNTIKDTKYWYIVFKKGDAFMARQHVLSHWETTLPNFIDAQVGGRALIGSAKPDVCPRQAYAS